MPGDLHLGLEVAQVRGGDEHAGRHPLAHGYAVSAELGRFVRVIRQQPDLRNAQRAQDLRGGGVVAAVRRKSQRLVGLKGVQPLILERVGVELVVEPDASALLTQVEQVPPVA